MFPIGDEPRRGRGLTLVTLGLLAINIVVFLYEGSLGPALENFIRTSNLVFCYSIWEPVWWLHSRIFI